MKYFDASKYLKMKDKNGDSVGVFIFVSKKRGAGKTYSITRELMKKYLEEGRQFILLTRYRKSLGGIASGMMKSMLMDNYPSLNIKERIKQKGTYSDILITEGEGERCCGYVLPINSFQDIKNVSSEFVNVDTLFFDEFMPEDNRYLTNEVDKLLNIYQSVARDRHAQLILASNTITMINPYFQRLGLSRLLQENTKRYVGEGVVFIRGDEYKDDKVKETDPVINLLKTEEESEYSLDTKNMIDKPDQSWGRATYLCNLRYYNKLYALRFYSTKARYYISDDIDTTVGEYATTTGDMIDTPLINAVGIFETLRRAFNSGLVVFKNNECRNFIFDIFKIN